MHSEPKQQTNTMFRLFTFFKNNNLWFFMLGSTFRSTYIPLTLAENFSVLVSFATAIPGLVQQQTFNNCSSIMAAHYARPQANSPCYWPHYWCCKSFKESKTARAWYRFKSYSKYNVATTKSIICAVCMENLALGDVFKINTALGFASRCINLLTHPLMLLFPYTLVVVL